VIQLVPILSALLAANGASADPASTGSVPVLVELFTSEGCSSCPAAESVLARLEREQPVAGARVVLLERHVTYFDGLGWKDRFGTASATARQQAYAERMRRDSIYTPQAVVDGAAEAVGSDRDALVRLVKNAAQRQKGSVVVRPSSGGRVEVEARWAGDRPAEVFAAAILPEVETDVQGGENAGRRLHHASVVVKHWKLGDGRGRLAAAFQRPSSPLGPVEIVAFVQEPDGGSVLAVGEEAAAAR
jgi:hypothetical protein